MTTLHEPALTTPAEPAVWPASTTEPRPGDLTVGGVSLAEVADRFGTAGGRLDALAEALPRVESRWSKLNPAPTRKIPVLIGGGGEKKTLRLVARHADIWHSFSDLETLVRKSAILEAHCRDAGRDPSEIERSVGTPDGNPAELAQPLLDAGATLFTVGVGGPDVDFTKLRAWLSWRDNH